jgi:hypothetical protein
MRASCFVAVARLEVCWAASDRDGDPASPAPPDVSYVFAHDVGSGRSGIGLVWRLVLVFRAGMVGQAC